MTDTTDSKFNQKAYDLWSKQYDQLPNSTIAVDEAHFPREWNHLSGKKILEIGCGTGRHTQKLAAQGNEVTGIEPSRGMLEVAKRRLSGQSVLLIQDDFIAYDGLPAATFDAIVCSLVLEHILDVDGFFRKILVLLRPGGEFFLSEIHPDRIAQGSQANFTDPESGENVRLVSYAHTDASIRKFACQQGLFPTVAKDVYGTAELAAHHPGWEKYLGNPMIRIWVFRK